MHVCYLPPRFETCSLSYFCSLSAFQMLWIHSLIPSTFVIVMKLPSTISTKDTFSQDFCQIPKRLLRNFIKSLWRNVSVRYYMLGGVCDKLKSSNPPLSVKELKISLVVNPEYLHQVFKAVESFVFRFKTNSSY